MNPIKSPTEMIYEEAGIPHYAGGGTIEAAMKLAPGAEQLFKTLSKKLSSVLGRAPTPEELHQLQQEIHGLSAPTSTMESANLARVAKQEPHPDMFADAEGRLFPRTAEGTMPTPRQRQYTAGSLQGPPEAGQKVVANSNYAQAFDPRDEFITQMNTGRGNRSTWLHASPEANLSDEATLLGQMDTGTELGGHPHQSVTPANDYIAQLADAMQAAGKEHDYTGMGAAVYGSRPSFGAGTLTKQQKAELEAWREQARAAGIPEHAVTAPPTRLGSDYKYLNEELNLGPAGPEASMGGYAEGGSVIGKYLGHGLGVLGAAPEAISAGQHALAGRFLPAAGSAIEAASTFLPLPLAAAYLGMTPTEMGDSTIEGWKRQEALRKQKESK